MQYMHEKMGAWQVDGDASGGRVQFRIFFPQEANGLQHFIKSIRVCGDFQQQLGQTNWDPASAAPMSRSAHAEGENAVHHPPQLRQRVHCAGPCISMSGSQRVSSGM